MSSCVSQTNEKGGKIRPSVFMRKIAIFADGMHFANKRVCFERDVDMTEGIDDILQSMYIIIDEMKVRFDPKKAQLVKKKHNVNMESVKREILAGNFDIDEVKKFP